MSADEPASSGTPEAGIRVSETGTSPAPHSEPSIFSVQGETGSHSTGTNATSQANMGLEIPQQGCPSVKGTEYRRTAIKSVVQRYTHESASSPVNPPRPSFCRFGVTVDPNLLVRTRGQERRWLTEVRDRNRPEWATPTTCQHQPKQSCSHSRRGCGEEVHIDTQRGRG